MALLFMEGFEQYGAIAELVWTKYTAQSTVPCRWYAYSGSSINAVTYRTTQPGGVSKSLYNSNSSYYTATSNPANVTNVYIGFAYYGSNGGGILSLTNMISYVQLGYITTGLMLYSNASGSLIVYNAVNSAVLLTTPAGTISTNLWFYIEINAVYGSGTSGSITLKVDGLQVGTVTGINTTCSIAATGWPYFVFGGSTNYYDDIYVCDNTTASNNTFIGSPNVYTLFPSAAGADTNMTPTGAANNWDCVNDTTPDTGTYVATASAAVQDTYAIQSMTASPTNVYAVTVSNYSEKIDNGPRQVQNVLTGNGFTSLGTLCTPINNDYRRSQDLFLTHPDGSAWSLALLATLQIGVKTS